MRICRKPLASLMLALAVGVPVCAGDMNSTPTTPAPTPPPPPCVATTAGVWSENVALPNSAFDAAAFAIDLLLSSMLSI